MHSFRQILERSGYRQFYLSFGDANFRRQDWPIPAPSLPSPLRELVKLLLLQEPVAREKAVELLGPECIEEFLRCGVVKPLGSTVGDEVANLQSVPKRGISQRLVTSSPANLGQALISNSFFLIFCRSHALFCQIAGHPWAYFGEDSLALVTLQTPAPGGAVLDLCCGPGIQSFVAANHAAKVTGVEVRPETWRIAELNRALNNSGDRIRFVCKSAEDFARSGAEKYDRILFNPPLVPMAPGYKFPFVANGGPDGLALTRRIISLYHKRISKDGSLQFIGTGLGRKDDPAVCRHLQTIARRYGLGGRIHLLSQHPIRPQAPLFESCVAMMARDNSLAPEKARKILLAHFSRLGYDAYYLFFASLDRASGNPGKLSVVDLTRSFWGSWFV